MQAKRRMRLLPSYRRLGVICKAGSQRGLQGVLAEAATGQVPKGAPAGPTPPNDRPSALCLGLEAAQRLSGQIGRDPVSLQFGGDRRVAVAPPGERLGPVPRVAAVVDEVGAGERLECLRAGCRGDGRAAQAIRHSVLGQVTRSQRSRSDRQGLRAAQLSPQDSQPGTVEHAPLGEVGPNDDLHRQDAPWRAVELDGDATPTRLAQRRDGRH